MLVSLGLCALASILIPLTQGAFHQVFAGDHAGDTRFNPQTINADVNDTVVFIFLDRHTVTQTGFNQPCANRTALSSFDSGFLLPGQNFTVPVLSLDTVWIRCSGNCGEGMVAAINAPDTGDRTFSKFQANAKGSTNNSSPYSTTSNYPTSSTSSPRSTTTSHGAATPRFVAYSPVSIVSGIFVLILGAFTL